MGPDGAVWWIDWYNFIVQHNPVPRGFDKGKGNAYVTPLRDKRHGRIYRVVYDEAQACPWPELENADLQTLVTTLGHDNMFWRTTAQRLLIERRWQHATLPEVVAALIERAGDAAVDEVGTNWGVVHAMWTLDGLGILSDDASDAMSVVHRGLGHRAMGVRKAALEVLPVSRFAARAIVEAGCFTDRELLIRQVALLRLAEMPASEGVGRQVFVMLEADENRHDRWLVDATTTAAARHSAGFVSSALVATEMDRVRAEVLQRVVTHMAASDTSDRLIGLVTHLPAATPKLGPAILHGLLDGWPSERTLRLSQPETAAVRRVLHQLSPATGELLLRLVSKWGLAEAFQEERAAVAELLQRQLASPQMTGRQRRGIAVRLLAIRDDGRTVEAIVEQTGAQQAPELVTGLFTALAESTNPGVAPAVLARWPQFTPPMRRAAIRLLLARRTWSQRLLDAIASEQLSADDLAIDERQQLITYPDRAIAERATQLLASRRTQLAGDRQQIVEALLPIAERPGDGARGRKVFVEQCAKCHTYWGEGAKIGPDLTGFAVHSKATILTEVLDPNRSVAGNYRQYYPLSVEIPCGVAAKVIHLLGGVAGWGYPLGERGSVSMIVRIHYADGSHEDHPLRNGRHIADYIRRVDVSESQFAFLLAGRQVRYLAIRPRRAMTIDRLELIKGPDNTAPIVMAVTAERYPPNE